MKDDIVIVAGARTAYGRAIRGTLAHTRPDDMGAYVIKEVVDRAPGVEEAEVDDVVMGCSWPASNSSAWTRRGSM